MINSLKTLKIILLFGFSAAAFAASENPQTFTIDGRLYADNAATTPLTDSDVNIVFQVMSADQTCVLYEETVSHYNASIGNGYFTLQVGSPIGAGKRSSLDSAHSMAEVYSNKSVSLTGRTVGGGACSYSPNVGDVRYLRMVVTPASDGVARVLSPNMVLSSVPTAVVAERAESLQGLGPSNLLQTNTTGSQVLSQTNLESIFTSSNYSALNSLLSGSSTLYSKQSANGTSVLPSVSSPSSPAAGQIWYDGGAIKFYNGSSTQTLGVSGAGITSLAAGTGLNVGAGPGGTITSSGTLNVDVGTTTGKILQVATGNKLPAIDGSALTNLPAPTSVAGSTISGTIGGSTSINTTGTISSGAITSSGAISGATGSFGSSSTGQLSLYDHATTNTNYITIKTPATATLTADYTLTLPAALPGSGTQALTSDTSGNLSWSPLASGSVTSVTSGGAPIVIGGTGTAPTVSVSAASTSAKGVVQLGTSSDTTAGLVVQSDDTRLTNSRAPTGTAGGDLSSTYPNPTVAKINGKAVTYTTITAGDVLKYDGTGWVNTALSSANLSNDSNLLKASNMPANCASGSTLTFSSPTGTWTCTSIPDATASSKGLMQVGTGLAVSSGNVSLASGVVTTGTYTKVTVDTYGRVTTGANIASSDVTTALGFTPVNKAGDVMTGTLGLASFTNTTEATLVGAFVAADKGKTWFNSDIKQMRMWDGSQIVDVAAGVKPTSSEDGKSLRWNDSTKTWEYFTAAAGSSSYWSAATGGINYSGGNVGINNASPSVPLDVTGDIKSSTAVYAPSGFISKVYTQSNAATAPGFSFVYSNDTGMFEAGTAGSHKLGFSTAGSERIRIDETGKVGIGTTSPNTKLEVSSGTANTSGLRLTNLTSSAPTSTGQAIGVDASGNIVTVTAGGGGTVTSVTSGGAPIVVGGTAAAPTVSVSDASTSAKGVVQLAASGGTTAGTVVEANDSRLTNARSPNGTASGDLSGSYPSPTVAAIKGKAVTYTSIATGDFLKYDGTGWVNAALSTANLSDSSSILKSSQMPANCAAGSTLTFSSPTGTWACTTITGISGSAITSGTVAAARLGSGTSDATTFLRGDGTWQNVASSVSAAVAPSFSVHKNGVNQTIATNTGTKLTFSTVAFDTINAWSTSTNRYTPTIAGKYLIRLHVYCPDSTGWCQSRINKNGAEITENGAYTGSAQLTEAVAIVDMNGTTDYLEAYAYNGGGTTVGGFTNHTNFEGALLAPLAAGSVAGTGTTNYIPQWTSSTTLTNSPIAVSGSNVGIGTSPAYKLDVAGVLRVSRDSALNDEQGQIRLASGTTSSKALILGYSEASDVAYIQPVHSGVTWNKNLSIIPNGGNVGIGTASPVTTLDINSSTTGWPVFINNNTPLSGSNYRMMGFKNAGSLVGDIYTSAGSVYYSANSDYRLKENVQTVGDDSLDRILRVPVRSYNYIGYPGSRVEGFLAHEVQQIAPYAVRGVKDEVDAAGKPVYQAVDYSKLTPLLTAAIQSIHRKYQALYDAWFVDHSRINEQAQKIEALESENVALKEAICEMNPQAKVCTMLRRPAGTR